MKDNPPRVSIGMPVYNGEKHLREAIEAILAQTFVDFELIISDNASTDQTEPICREYVARDTRVRYVRQDQNKGAAANFNHVFELARGEYFKWAACDDLIAPTFLEYCVAVLEQSPEYVLAFPDRLWMTHEGHVISNNGQTLPAVYRPPFHRISYPRLVCQLGSSFPNFVFGLTRREVLARTGLIGAYNLADLVVVAELRLLGEFWQVPDHLFFERLHDCTPDYLRRLTARGEMEWYDPQRRQRWLLPNLKVTREQLAAVWRSKHSMVRKLGYSLATLAGRPVATLRLRLRPWVTSVWRMWSQLTVNAARMSRSMCLALRVWALFAGLRRMESQDLRVAFSRPWFTENLNVLRFAALRLAKRTDPLARQLLTSWLNGPCQARHVAALEAMNRHPTRFGRFIEEYQQRETAAGRIKVDLLRLSQPVASSARAVRRDKPAVRHTA